VKIQATLKHYTAYSVEDNRGHDNANISRYDMADSFLRQYEMGFVQGNASVRETHIRFLFFETPFLFQEIKPDHLPRQARAKHITRQAPRPSGVISENRA